MATTDEINAGFDVANSSLLEIVQTLIPDQSIPFVGNLRSIALQKLQSPEGRLLLLKEVRQVLAAAEAVRNK